MSWNTTARSVLDERRTLARRRRALRELVGQLAQLLGEPFSTTWAALEREAPSLVTGGRALPGELESALLTLQRRREAYLVALRAFDEARRAEKRRGRRSPAPGAAPALQAAHRLPSPTASAWAGETVDGAGSGAALLRRLQLVRVTALRTMARLFDGSVGFARPPAVGDVGMVVEVLRVPGHAPRFLVEATADGGATTWLADFDASELTPEPG